MNLVSMLSQNIFTTKIQRMHLDSKFIQSLIFANTFEITQIINKFLPLVIYVYVVLSNLGS